MPVTCVTCVTCLKNLKVDSLRQLIPGISPPRPCLIVFLCSVARSVCIIPSISLWYGERGAVRPEPSRVLTLPHPCVLASPLHPPSPTRSPAHVLLSGCPRKAWATKKPRRGGAGWCGPRGPLGLLTLQSSRGISSRPGRVRTFRLH